MIDDWLIEKFEVGFGECIRDARVYTISYRVHVYKIVHEYGGSNKIYY